MTESYYLEKQQQQNVSIKFVLFLHYYYILYIMQCFVDLSFLAYVIISIYIYVHHVYFTPVNVVLSPIFVALNTAPLPDVHPHAHPCMKIATQTTMTMMFSSYGIQVLCAVPLTRIFQKTMLV